MGGECLRASVYFCVPFRLRVLQLQAVCFTPDWFTPIQTTAGPKTRLVSSIVTPALWYNQFYAKCTTLSPRQRAPDDVEDRGCYPAC